MNWIGEIILGLIDIYGTNNSYELCDSLNIKIIKTDPANIIVRENPSLYIRDYEGEEVIFIRNDMSEHYEDFYIKHELGHAILHTHLSSSLNENLINKDKLEKQANYFAFKLSGITFNELELEQLTIEQISIFIEIPLTALKQIVNC